jgi:hypothetical protein
MSKKGEIGESRPCYHCLKSLKKSGIKIKHVYYSTEAKIITREKFKDMINVEIYYVSSGNQVCKNMVAFKIQKTLFIYVGEKSKK